MADLHHEALLGKVTNDGKFDCGWTVLQDHSVDILINGAFYLNSLLPDNVSFLQVAGKMPRVVDGKVRLDVENVKNPYYRAIVAHEVGHAFDDDIDTTHGKIIRYELNIDYAREFHEFTVDQKLKYILDLARMKQIREVNAWDHGKSVSNLLGVEESQYEDAMTDSLETYYLGEQIKVIQRIDKSCSSLSDDKMISFYNPYSDSSDLANWGDFKMKFQDLNRSHENSLKKCYMKAGVNYE